MVSVVDNIQRFFLWFPSLVFWLWFPSLFLLLFPSWQENVCLWFPSLDCWWILPPQEDPTFQNVSSDSSLCVFLGLVSVVGFCHGFRYVCLWFPLRVFIYGFRRGRKTFVFIVSVVVLLYGFRRGKERFLMVSAVLLFMVSGCYRTAAFSPMETVKQNNSRTFP